MIYHDNNEVKVTSILGAEGRVFESLRPDHLFNDLVGFAGSRLAPWSLRNHPRLASMLIRHPSGGPPL